MLYQMSYMYAAQWRGKLKTKHSIHHFPLCKSNLWSALQESNLRPLHS